MAKLLHALTHIEGEVWLGSLIGEVCMGKRKLRVNMWRIFQIPSLAIPDNIKVI